MGLTGKSVGKAPGQKALKHTATKKHKKQVKQFTWDELQAGADAPPSPHKSVKESAAVTKAAPKKAGALLQNLKAAPRIKVTSKATVQEADPVHAALEKA